MIKSFGFRIASHLDSSNINTKTFKNIISLIFHPNIALLNQLSFSDLHSSKTSLSDSHLTKQNFQELQSQPLGYQYIYTNGAKVEDKVGCA